MATKLLQLLRVCFLTTAIGVLPICSPALADSINISGTFGDFSVASSGTGTATLAGDRGFTAKAGTDVVDASVGPFNSCTPCLAGDPVNVGLTAVGLAMRGFVTLDGLSYGIGSVNGPNMNLQFTGPPLFAPTTNAVPLATLTGPVNFSGSVERPVDPSQPPFTPPFITEGLTAAAATVTVVLQDIGRCTGAVDLDCWNLVSATYELTPIPEPTTLLLVGTTMAGLVLAAWRRQGRS